MAEKSTKILKEEEQQIAIWALFKYAERRHMIYILCGFMGAIISSAAIPLFIVVFGGIVDVFVDYETNKNSLLNSTSSSIANSLKLNISSRDDRLEQLDKSLMNDVYLYSSLMGVSCFLYGFGRFLALYSMQLFSLTYTTKLKRQFFKSILAQNITWFDGQKSGEFASRISNDFKKFESGINENFALIMALICSGVFNTGCAIYFGWQLALIILVSVPIIASGLIVTSKYINRYSQAETEIYAQVSSIAEESISAIRTVKAFSAADKERERYNHKLKVGFRNSLRRNIFNAFSTAFNWGVLYCFLGLGTYFGVRFIADEMPGYSLGVFTMIFWNAISVGYNFGEIAPYLEAFNISRAVAANLFKIIDSSEPNMRSKYEKTPELKLDPNYKAEIEFRNVSFQYPSRSEVKILDKFNLKIHSGETVALVGASGCGKSTIVQLLQKFYEPSSGEIFVDGRQLNSFDVDWWRAQVGVVGQEPVLFDETIEENILLGIKDQSDDNCSVVEVSKQANAHSFVDALADKYQTYVGDSGTQLSGGQKQRIAIARALISRPKVLLLDEATSALDVRSEKIVQEALDKAAQNRTTIIVAHRLSTIKNVDRIVVIQNGKLVEQGTHQQLLDLDGIYKSMIISQQVLLPDTSEDSDSEQNNLNLLRTESVLESKEDVLQNKTQKAFHSDQEKETSDHRELVSFGRLWSLVKGDKLILLVGVICALLFGLGTPLYALIYGALVQEFSENGGNDDGTLVERCNKYAWQFVGLGSGKFVSCFIQILIFGYIGEKLTYKLRCSVFDSILEQEVEWFDRKENSAGAVCAKIADDSANIQSASGLRISTLLQAFSTMSITIPLGFYYNWQMATFSFFLMPLIFGAFLVSQKLSSEQASQESEVAKKASKIVVQVMNSIRTVSSLNKQTYFYQRFEGNILKHQKRMSREIWKKSVFYGLTMGTSFAAYALAFLFAGYLIKGSIISVSNMFRIVESMIYGAIAVGQTSVLSGDFAKARHAIANMLSLIDIKPKQLREVTTLSNNKSSGNVEFRDVSFNYPSRPKQVVLDGFSFTANQGETVTLVGQSGCGKSTTIQLLEQFYKPDRGQILIDGKVISEREWSRRQMSLVSQEPILFNCSIRDNIAYGDTSRHIDDAEIFSAVESTNIKDFISKLPQGLDTPVGQRGTQLSGGQKQRIAIARALIRNPPILLLDEATSALDTESEKLVQDALEKASKGRTCIVIAHRLKTIVNSSKIVVIHKGKAVEQGKHDELIDKKGFYWKLFNLYKL